MYDPVMVQPMRDELTRAGFDELRSAEEVDQALGGSGTVLCVVNSVCGCAAANARPGATQSLTGDGPRPDRVTTVFAGMDLEAVARARQLTTGYPPSSPSIALFKDGQVVFMLQRHQIEGRDATQVAGDLTQAYQEFC